jgi:tetratricopeptide (TPR) repeat protein
VSGSNHYFNSIVIFSACTVGNVLVQPPQGAIAAPTIVSACPDASRSTNGLKAYDVIVFGDEVPGVMTAIQVRRELQKRNQPARVLLMTEGDTTQGIGGHLVRGGLAYLDRNQVPRDKWSTLGKFAPASPLYRDFLNITGTQTIALDRFKANAAFKRILAQEKVDVIGNVKLQSVTTTATTVCSLNTASNGTFAAKQFIDATQGAKFAEMAGAKMFPGFAALGLPDSSLSIGLVFEAYGLTIDELKQVETKLIRRLQNPNDQAAKEWLNVASGNDAEHRQAILTTLTTHTGEPETLYQATSDSADVRSLAISTAFHGSNNSEILNATETLDRANIAVLGDRLSFNAILFYTDATKARELSHQRAKPEAYMVEFAAKVQKFFQGLGASRVETMNELYIRSTEQIANPVEELSSTLMTKGGVPADEALGTFSYHLDVRGGIKGLGARAATAGIKSIDFHYMPTFNYGFRHTLPKERQNLAVLGPTSGFGGLGEAAGRIVEFNVSVGEGLAIAVAKAITENRSLPTIKNRDVRQQLGYTPEVYGRPTESFTAVFQLEKELRSDKVALIKKLLPKKLLGLTQTELEKGIQNSEEGKYRAAIENYARAIAQDPKNPLAYYNRGIALTYLHKYQAAIADYTRAIELKPDFAEAYKNRGLVHIQSHQHLKEAVTDYDKAIKLNPSNASSYVGKGLALTLIGKRKEAIEPLTEAIKLKPDLAIAYFVRGSVALDLVDRATALTNYQKAADLYKQQGNESAYSNTLRAIEEIKNAK